MKSFLETYKTYVTLVNNDSFDFEKFSHFSIVHHSNSIEGSTLTKEETYMLLDEQLTPNNKPLEHSLMAVDHLEALKYTIELGKNKEILTVDIIKRISSLIMKTTGSMVSAMAGDFDSSKGDFRKVTVRAGTSTFIDYKKVPKRVEELVNYINSNIKDTTEVINQYELAFDAHFQIVSIHPFADGNGRLSRLLMNYVQQYYKQPLSIVYRENKQAYFNALIETRKTQDISVFRKFMFEQAEKYMQEKIKEFSQIQSNIKKGKGMSFLF